MSEYIPVRGYIYLIKMSDINSIFVYKVSKSTKSYIQKPFTEVLTGIFSDDIANDKLELIKLFNINCILYKGKDFFTAQDDYFVLDLFINYFNSKNKKNIEKNNTSNIVNKLLHELINDVNNDVNSTMDNNVVQTL